MATSTSHGRSVVFLVTVGLVLFMWSPLGPSARQHHAGGRVAGHGYDAGFETSLVAVGGVHVAELRVCGDGTAAGADRDERTVVAAFPRRQLIEPARGGRTDRARGAVDVPGRHLLVAREARAGVEIAVRADRVGVLLVDLTGSHVDAVARP